MIKDRVGSFMAARKPRKAISMPEAVIDLVGAVSGWITVDPTQMEWQYPTWIGLHRDGQVVVGQCRAWWPVRCEKKWVWLKRVWKIETIQAVDDGGGTTEMRLKNVMYA